MGQEPLGVKLLLRITTTKCSKNDKGEMYKAQDIRQRPDLATTSYTRLAGCAGE